MILPGTADQDPCGDQVNSACTFVLDRTGNDTLARITNWFVDWPLRIVLVLVVAWVATPQCRRWVRRADAPGV